MRRLALIRAFQATDASIPRGADTLSAAARLSGRFLVRAEAQPDLAQALLPAVPAFVPTPGASGPAVRREESRRCRQECLRHLLGLRSYSCGGL